MPSYANSTLSTVARTPAEPAGSARCCIMQGPPAFIPSSLGRSEPSSGLTVFERGGLNGLLRNDRDELYLKDEHLIWANCTARTTGTISEV